MSNWIKTDTLQSGDIIELPGKILGYPFLIRHYGVIVHNEQGSIMVAHNPGNTTQLTPLNEVVRDVDIQRVLRTGLTDAQVMDGFQKCRNKPYNIAFWSCEDVIVAVTGHVPGWDQRRITAAILLGIILIALFLILRKL